ncbi:MAG: MFS transporter [Anaerolineales bacterium]|nr:MFS transporter [Anaerolineales bacterium]MCW5854989.1 MFS transporter [Anaerolineales bacterium]
MPKFNTGFWVLVSTILGSCMSYIDATVIYIALPVVQQDLNATVVQAQWIVEAYVLFQAALILVGGTLGDRLGRRRVFAVGVVIFSIASALCGLATTPGFLIGARILQALGGALLGPSSLAIITAYFDDERRGAAFGAWSGASAIALALGPAVGGLIVQYASWHWLFFINVPVGILTVLVLFWKVPESRDEKAPSKLDWRGASLATLGLGMFVFGFIESANYGLGSPIVLGSIFLGAAVFALFLYTQRITENPLLPLDLFKSRTFSGANLITLLMYCAVSGVIFFLPFNLIQIQGYDIVMAGLGFLPFPLIVGALSGWAGGLVARYGSKLPLTIGPLVVAAGLVLFGQAGLGGSFWTTFFPAVIVLAFGMTLVIAPLTTTVMGAAPKRLSGTASGINTAVNSTANVLAVAILGVVALNVFIGSVERRVDPAQFTPQALSEIRAETKNLANASAPASLPPAQRQEIDAVYDQAFVDAFQIVMYVCAGLVATASLVAQLFVDGKPKHAPTTEALPRMH